MQSKLLLALPLALFAGAAVAATGELPSFDELDAGGQGVVTRDEAEQAPQVAAAFDEIDLNGDGVIDRAEYAQWQATQDQASAD